MEKPAHTPLPWRITEPDKKKPREIVGANGATVARLTVLDMPNAELIVSSVNMASSDAELDDMPSTLSEVWEAALAHAAMYVEHHCVDGEMHADAIMRMGRPTFTAKRASFPDAERIMRVLADNDIGFYDGESDQITPFPVDGPDAKLYLDALAELFPGLRVAPPAPTQTNVA